MTVKKWPPQPQIIRRPDLHVKHSRWPVGLVDILLGLFLAAFCFFAFYMYVCASYEEKPATFDNISREKR